MIFLPGLFAQSINQDQRQARHKQIIGIVTGPNPISVRRAHGRGTGGIPLLAGFIDAELAYGQGYGFLPLNSSISF
jgi:hypothetical protein